MTDKKSIVIKLKYPVHGPQSEEASVAPQMITEWNIKRIAMALGALLVIIALPLYFYFNSSTQEDSHPPSENLKKIADLKSDSGIAADSGKDKGAQAVSLDNATDAKVKRPEPIKEIEPANRIVAPVETNLEENKGKEKSDIKVNEPVIKQPVVLEKKKGISEAKSNKVVRALLAHKIINKNPVDIINSTVRVSKNKPVWINYFTELKGMDNSIIYHEWMKKGKVVTRQRLKISADSWRTFSSKLFNHTAEGLWSVRVVDGKGRLLVQNEFNVILDR